MNGKIKTKFAALFAVALMITVCVVPMVGGSEDVEAATTETVSISGIVKDAAGQGWGGLEVYVDGTNIKKTTATADDPSEGIKKGDFSLADVPVKDTIVVKVNVGKYLSDGTTNPAYGVSFPDITLNGVNVDQTIEIIAGTVEIEGKLALKGETSSTGGTFVVKEGISITGTGSISAVTDSDGEFKFYGIPGIKYDLSASFAGVDFEQSITPAKPTSGSTTPSIILEAKSSMMKVKVSAPVGELKYTPANTDKISIGDLTFNKEGSNYYVYAPISMITGGTTNPKVVFEYGYGLYDSAEVELVVNATGNISASTILFTSSINNLVSGNVTIGGVSVTPTSVTLVSTQDATDKPDYNKKVNAAIVGDEYFVGTIYDYEAQTITPIPNWKLVTVATTGYIFNEPTSNSTEIAAQNVASVTVEGDVSEKSFDVRATNAIVGKDGYKTDAYGEFTFYVPLNTSNVVISAPDNYSPSAQTISTVYSDMTVTFDYIDKVCYKGEVLLNGYPVSIDAKSIYYETDGEEFTNDLTGDIVYFNTPVGDTPYYTIKLDRTVDVSKVKVKIKLDANDKASGFLFEENVNDTGYTAAVGITGTTIGAFNVKSENNTWTVKDAGSNVIPGMEIDVVMIKGESYASHLIVAELGTATTDVFGKATVSAAKPATGYKLYAVPSGECEYGKYTFSYPAYATYDITANENTYTGYYTTDGSELKGFGMSFIANNSDGAIAYGDAKIIGNKYYVVVPSGTTSVDLKALDGFTIKDQNGTTGYFNITNSANIVATAVEPEIEEFKVTLMINSEFLNNVNVSVENGKYDEGTVIVLSAEKVCYALQNNNLQYTYTDAAVEYKFAGWYVNGKLLTEDCDAMIKLSEDIVIVAQYEEAVKVVGSADVPEAGLDTNVLILGIVVVVIALIAVVYSVISKKD